jgi:coenzyme F420-reducing hydrogenase delta subunit
MCTGRIDPAFILRGFANGVDGVFIGGCWLGECHYLTEGNHHAIVVMLLTRKLLKHAGIDSDRLRLEWVSAAQGSRFAEVVTDFSEKLKELGPLGKSEGIDERTMKLRLEAARSLIPYMKLVERERLRVRFNTKEEYEAYFDSAEVERVFQETVGQKLVTREIMLLLREKAMSAEEIAETLGLGVSEVSGRLNRAAREGTVRYDEIERLYSLAGTRERAVA